MLSSTNIIAIFKAICRSWPHALLFIKVCCMHTSLFKVSFIVRGCLRDKFAFFIFINASTDLLLYPINTLLLWPWLVLQDQDMLVFHGIIAVKSTRFDHISCRLVLDILLRLNCLLKLIICLMVATSCILKHYRLLLVKFRCYMSKWEHISSMTRMWLIWLYLWRWAKGILRRMLVFIRAFRSNYSCIRTFLIHSHKLLSHRFYLSIRT